MNYIHLLQPQRRYLMVSYQKLRGFLKLITKELLLVLHTVKKIGVTVQLSEDEKSRLGIFNYLNLFQLISGIIVPLLGIFYGGKIPLTGWLIACLPPLLSVFVLYLNKLQKYQDALVVYFIFYPFFTCL
ncbi:MAG: hypothetical protein ACXWWC_06125, partial [Chitinophagaceae bacterium]